MPAPPKGRAWSSWFAAFLFFAEYIIWRLREQTTNALGPVVRLIGRESSQGGYRLERNDWPIRDCKNERKKNAPKTAPLSLDVVMEIGRRRSCAQQATHGGVEGSNLKSQPGGGPSSIVTVWWKWTPSSVVVSCHIYIYIRRGGELMIGRDERLLCGWSTGFKKMLFVQIICEKDVEGMY